MESQPESQEGKMNTEAKENPEDNPLHSAVKARNLNAVKEILTRTSEEKLAELLRQQNASGQTALYLASAHSYVELAKEMIMYYDIPSAELKARNGFDPLLIAAKNGDLDMIKALVGGRPELSMTVDASNSTALHIAAARGNIEVVDYFLELGFNLGSIAKTNGKTPLHSAARGGYVQVVESLLSKEMEIGSKTDNKGQTALHMAVKIPDLEIVNALVKDIASLNLIDNKGNTALHIATQKGSIEVVKLLLEQKETDPKILNKVNETALDIAQKTSQSEIVAVMQEYGVQSAQNSEPTNPAKELKQTVSDIKHEVHNQLEHTRQTRRRVQGIAKRVNKLHAEGLNNAINSTTVVAVLIATVAFAAIFTVPGQYVDDVNHIPPGHSLGEANIASQAPFLIFFIFDSIALFISLAVVVVQTSVVVIESKAKKQMMAIINKLMWLACVLISVAFLSLSFIVVGKREKWLAIGVTIIGTTILATTLGTMCYWVIMHRIESSNKKSMRKSSRCSGSKSWSVSVLSDTEVLNNDYKKMYAI